ncbi:hypothetical protein JCM16303_001110 [Sporobolomyces ruberrimus]
MDPRRFIWSLPEHLVCPGCKMALEEGVYACQVGHAACRACLEKKGECLTCREPVPKDSEFEPATDLIEMIGEYWIRCGESKCRWAGPAKDEKAHRSTCGFRSSLCEGCGSSLVESERLNHFLKECPETRVTCPRGGKDCGGVGRGSCKRKDAFEHDSVCANFSCRLKNCPTRTTLENLSSHEPACHALRHALSSAIQSSSYFQHFSNIHHANASRLSHVLSQLSNSSTLNPNEHYDVVRSKVLHPRLLDYPVESEFLIVPGVPSTTTSTMMAKGPITPITPGTGGNEGGGGGGGNVSTGASSQSVSSSFSSTTLPDPPREFWSEDQRIEVIGLIVDAEERAREGSASVRNAKKRKLDVQG